MSKDVMTPEERLQAAIELKPVDRVPCAPWIVEYAGRFAGITNKEFFADWNKKMAAYRKLKEAYPVWDINRESSSGFTVGTKAVWPMRAKMPGVELSDNAPRQMVEEEFATREDLMILKEQGYMPFILHVYQKMHGLNPEEILASFKLAGELDAEEKKEIERLGQTMYYGSIAFVPFEMLCFWRSIQKAFKDMFQVPDFLDEIFPIIAKASIGINVAQMNAIGVKRVFISGTRSAPQFLSKKNFERFCWPYYKELALTFIENGFTPSFHFDCNWTDFLEYFLELPKGKCVLELDSSTDIFKAKEILKGHMCILGDVSPILFTVASSTEMDEYCKKLIQVVGKDGGFIFSNGCTIPYNSKHENVKVFFEAVEKYGRYN
ncbi:MAG: uroporphyrinogen decarboxylase family protein [Bacillota bacterium]